MSESFKPRTEAEWRHHEHQNLLLRSEDLKRLRKGDFVESRDGRLGRVLVGRVKRAKGEESIVVQFTRITRDRVTFLKEGERVVLSSLWGQHNEYSFMGRLRAEQDLVSE